ncbi:hypothetical protein D9758_010842 [Tetrapyrgos nigripes]|uniref:F-box domain-containing protein n=1 Tax=Tetrapyrgos nigripes TaxID=182062 RepID=A0A8H5LQ85_9AGAR|nr:hypothetical protein D9758_010842 [Tetrapyrgos nigripes]
MDTLLDSAIAPSRFEDLLKSNDPPLDSEVAILIAQLGATLSRLANSRRERSDLEGMIVQYKLILTPMRRVPNDVLAEIFSVVNRIEYEDQYESYHWEATYNYPFNDIASFQQAPWTLSHVCGRWRSLSLSLPLLWSHIHFRFGDYSSEIRRAPHLLLQLERSRDVSLDLILEQVPSDEHGILAMLLVHAPRWRHLTFSAEALDTLMMFSLTPMPFRSLQFLNISCDTEPEIAPAIPRYFKGPFSSADALRQVKLSGMANPHILGIPWSQLDSLFLDGMSSWRNTFAVLRRLARAVEVTLVLSFIEEDVDEEDGDDKEEDGDRTSILWPHVQTLKLQCFVPDDAARLLGLLDAPSMQIFIMPTMLVPFPDYSSCILFIRRSFPPLQQLTISVQNIDSGFSNVLRHIPSLLELHLQQIASITDDFLHSLVYSQNQSLVLVPDLTTLELDWQPWEDFLPLNLVLMTEVIESRSGIFMDEQASSRIRPLQKVQIDFGYLMGDEEDAMRDMKLEMFKSSLVSFCTLHHLNIELDLSWHP